MEPYRIFISSVMKKENEDLLAERDAVRKAVDHFGPLTTAWAFEAEPASSKPMPDFYLDEVKSCDLVLLLIGDTLTAPVKTEFETAREHGKPMLLFVKSGSSRKREAADLLISASLKYDTFGDVTEL